ncbi:flagellar biosynthesis anti-sigma factor FlgM [Halomonas sp. CUBES01]|uniref:Negative regulator of flagellin synthesis n=1 Tax=Vreelandella gomseomensis TaxID=370766 RepID=A0ABU1GDZ6_9GAMM|nr:MULTISPECIES: flagellar biosynthesis anti-sigma factor FlgM [Halomonas]MDR5875303.1 flagellar biosynthesis anti-sigma factor FlgM [Halomonas gomseomensis]MEC4765834.1 flagellar biosynthesis anti-sigma factor FlgM [Halomonas sp. CUBES01]
MKIDNVNNPLLRSGPAQQRDDTQKAGSSPSATSGTEAKGSTQLSTQSADATHDIDSAKVEEIRDAIRDGRLEIRADRIADGLIANLRESQE